MRWLIANINDFSDQDFEKALFLASDSRKRHFLSFKRKEARKRSIVGEILIKRILKENYSLEAFIECDKNGKPYIENSELYISISHSFDMVFAAVSEKPIGVDIERIKDINFSVAKKFANDEELEYIGSDLKRFYEIWTAKEAYYKMTGGSAVNFKSFSVFSLQREIVLNKDYLAQIVTKREG